MGNEFLYYQLATENIETLNAYGAKKIIVQCPHCAQALERDYPQLGGRFEVVRHAQLLERLVAEGRLPGAERARRRRSSASRTTTRATWDATPTCTTSRVRW